MRNIYEWLNANEAGLGDALENELKRLGVHKELPEPVKEAEVDFSEVKESTKDSK
jgi:hypothetical protein